MKKIFFPKNKSGLPIAKKNIHGHIITNHVELKKVYLEHFVFRMRGRPIRPGMETYEKEVKLKLRNILSSTQNIQSPDWTIFDLNKVLRTLKSSQSQDTMNIINELFMTQNIGQNLKLSLVRLFNNIKNNQFIPDVFKRIHITSIPKKSKSPLDLASERGIFLVPKLRSLLAKLIYNSIIDDIESELSPSNIGARRNRSPRDNLFIVYAVVHETVKGKHVRCVDLVFSDVTESSRDHRIVRT